MPRRARTGFNTLQRERAPASSRRRADESKSTPERAVSYHQRLHQGVVVRGGTALQHGLGYQPIALPPRRRASMIRDLMTLDGYYLQKEDLLGLSDHALEAAWEQDFRPIEEAEEVQRVMSGRLSERNYRVKLLHDRENFSVMQLRNMSDDQIDNAFYIHFPQGPEPEDVFLSGKRQDVDLLKYTVELKKVENEHKRIETAAILDYRKQLLSEDEFTAFKEKSQNDLVLEREKLHAEYADKQASRQHEYALKQGEWGYQRTKQQYDWAAKKEMEALRADNARHLLYVKRQAAVDASSLLDAQQAAQGHAGALRVHEERPSMEVDAVSALEEEDLSQISMAVEVPMYEDVEMLGMQPVDQKYKRPYVSLREYGSGHHALDVVDEEVPRPSYKRKDAKAGTFQRMEYGIKNKWEKIIVDDDEDMQEEDGDVEMSEARGGDEDEDSEYASVVSAVD